MIQLSRKPFQSSMRHDFSKKLNCAKILLAQMLILECERPNKKANNEKANMMANRKFPMHFPMRQKDKYIFLCDMKRH
jgi:hypothetical protein